MYWKSDPMFVCRLDDKDLPALGGPAEKVRGWAGGRRGSGAWRGSAGLVAPGAAVAPSRGVTAAAARVPAGPTGVGGLDGAGAGLLGVAGS